MSRTTTTTGGRTSIVTALAGETFPLFRNDGHGAFVEATQASGLARLTVKSSGWCSIVADIDNDGWKDIFTANSHVNDRIGDFQAIEFKQSQQPASQRRSRAIPRRDGTRPVSRGAVAAHRGCGVADFNGDGRLDLVVLVLGAPAELWKNESATRQPVADRPARRHQKQPRRHRRARDRRQSGAHDDHGDRLRVVLARGSALRAGDCHRRPMRVEVQWPSGTRQIVEHVKTNQVIEMREK